MNREIKLKQYARHAFRDARGFGMSMAEENSLDGVICCAIIDIENGHGEKPYRDYIEECAHGQRKMSAADYTAWMREGIE